MRVLIKLVFGINLLGLTLLLATPIITGTYSWEIATVGSCSGLFLMVVWSGIWLLLVPKHLVNHAYARKSWQQRQGLGLGLGGLLYCGGLGPLILVLDHSGSMAGRIVLGAGLFPLVLLLVSLVPLPTSLSGVI